MSFRSRLYELIDSIAYPQNERQSMVGLPSPFSPTYVVGSLTIACSIGVFILSTFRRGLESFYFFYSPLPGCVYHAVIFVEMERNRERNVYITPLFPRQ